MSHLSLRNERRAQRKAAFYTVLISLVLASALVLGNYPEFIQDVLQEITPTEEVTTQKPVA
ncbi:MAG: hypothetical protein AAFU67_12195 [Bacteroidota bacterium]